MPSMRKKNIFPKRKIAALILMALFVACAIFIMRNRNGQDAGQITGNHSLSNRLAFINAFNLNTAASSPSEAEPIVTNILRDTSLSKSEKFYALWHGYMKNKGKVSGVIFLDALERVRPDRPLETILVVDKELHERDLDIATRKSLMRYLSACYITNEKSEKEATADELRGNDTIVTALHREVDYGEVDTAGYAALLYSRLGYFDDSLAMLEKVKNVGGISSQDYTKELTFLLPASRTDANATKILQALSASATSSQDIAYGLSTAINIPGYLDKLTNTTIPQVESILIANQPKFDASDPSSFDLVQSVRFVEWLTARARLKTKVDDSNSVDQNMVNLLSTQDIDQRALLSVLLSPTSESIIAILSKNGRLEQARQSIDTFKASLPPESPVHSLVGEARARIQSTK